MNVGERVWKVPSVPACLFFLCHVWGIGINSRLLEQGKVENLGAFFSIWSRVGLVEE